MALTIKEALRKWGPEYLAICGYYKYFPTMNSQSHVFFVNGTSGIGDDGVNTGGQIPDEPFLTITHALSKCTDGANDYVFILDYPTTAPATEVFPIAINKQRIHIIGVLNGLIPRFKIVAPGDTTDTPVFVFEDDETTGTYGAYCEIANLIMGSQKAASVRGAIEFHYGGIWGTHIHHCGFGLAGRSNTDCAYGIIFGRSSDTYQAGECLYGLIEHCSFGELVSIDGIYMPGGTGSGPNAGYGTIIRNNTFKVAGTCIQIARAADYHEAAILNNTFIVSSGAGGKACDIVAGVTGLIVDGNHALLADSSVVLTAEVFESGTGEVSGISWGVNYISGTLLVAEASYCRA